MRLARELAERITALTFDNLPPAAIDASRIAVLDTLGVTLAGSREAAPKLVEEVLGLQTSQGPSLIFGTRRRASALVVGAEAAAAASRSIASLETVTSVRELTALLEPTARVEKTPIVHA